MPAASPGYPRLVLVSLVLSVLGAWAVLLVLHAAPGHWLQVHTGTVNEPGPYYGFWSGFGSDITEFGIFGLVLTWIAGWWHKHNCHVGSCWRIGLHPLAGGTYVVCRRHHAEVTGHPHRKLTAAFLRERHQEHLAACGCAR